VQSEIQETRYVEIDEGGNRFREKHLKVEHFGIAHDVTSLIEWAPDCFRGKTLARIGIPNPP
jgi:hypothetical protein